VFLSFACTPRSPVFRHAARNFEPLLRTHTFAPAAPGASKLYLRLLRFQAGNRPFDAFPLPDQLAQRGVQIHQLPYREVADLFEFVLYARL
jgi:hypothetical protein